MDESQSVEAPAIENPLPQTLSLPFDEWESFIDQSRSIETGSNAPDNEDGETSTARCAVLSGMMLVTYGVAYGGLGRSVAMTWKIVPRQMWNGNVSKVFYKRDDAMRRRSKSDYLGCLVSINGREYVICGHVEVKAAMPTRSTQISVESAMAHYAENESEYVKGRQTQTRWEFFHGHPMVVYKDLNDDDDDDDDRRNAFLYCKIKKSIQRIYIKDVAKTKLLFSQDTPTQVVSQVEEQMALF